MIGSADRVALEMQRLNRIKRNLFEQMDSVADRAGVNQKSVCQECLQPWSL